MNIRSRLLRSPENAKALGVQPERKCARVQLSGGARRWALGPLFITTELTTLFILWDEFQWMNLPHPQNEDNFLSGFLLLPFSEVNN